MVTSVAFLLNLLAIGTQVNILSFTKMIWSQSQRKPQAGHLLLFKINDPVEALAMQVFLD